MLIVKYEKRGYQLFLPVFKPNPRVDYTKIIKKAGNLFNQEIIFY